MRKYDLTKLKSLWLAGERSEPGIIRKYQGLLNEIAGPDAIVNDKYGPFDSAFICSVLTCCIATGLPNLAPPLPRSCSAQCFRLSPLALDQPGPHSLGWMSVLWMMKEMKCGRAN